MSVNDELMKLQALVTGETYEESASEDDDIGSWNSLFEAEDGDDGDSKDDDKGDDGDDASESGSDDLGDDTDDDDPPDVSDDDAITIPEGDDGDEPPALDDEGGEGDGSALDEISEKIKLTGPEREILNNLIDSETDAITEYAGALNETKNKYTRKLYTELLSDESRHLAQLRHLLSMADDTGYTPKDQEAVQELTKTLESVAELLKGYIPTDVL